MYKPLLICKNFDITNLEKNPELKHLLHQYLPYKDEICNFIYFGDFMNPEYSGKYHDFNDYFLKYKKNVFKLYDIHDSGNDRNYMADIIYPFLLAHLWGKSKQVYAFDSEMELSLADTEEVHIPVRILDRLPYRCFYIEFAENGIFSSNNHGSFVHIIPTENHGYNIIFLRLGTDNMMDTLMVPFNQNGEFVVNRNFDIIEKLNHSDMKEFSMFVLNAILYLCAENADIEENSVTKSTYRPSQIPKNKFSEIRKWDCGVRYGTVIRKQKNNDKKELKEKTKSVNRLPARPYVRRAHWHHYWTGPGRTVLSLRWIAPVFVGAGETCAVIHKVEQTISD